MANQYTAPYTDDELDLIESKYRELGPTKLAQMMPGRTVYGITYKARFLDIDGGAKETNHKQRKTAR